MNNREELRCCDAGHVAALPLLNNESLPTPTTLVVDGETNPFTTVNPKRVKTRANLVMVVILCKYTVFGVVVMNTGTS